MTSGGRSGARFALTTGLLAAVLALTSIPAIAGDSVAGRYRLNDGPDVASELILKPDGSFAYFLMAGALDEQAHGTWRVEGKAVRLTTVPKPVPAVFSKGPSAPAPGGGLAIHVTDKAGSGIALVHFTLGFDSGPPVTGYTQDYGWSMGDGETRMPRWIELSVPMFNLRSPRFPLDLSGGRALTFILTPNDLGTIDFTGMQIDIQPNRLIMHREGALIPYEAAGTPGQ
jgi:hypothetical protein